MELYNIGDAIEGAKCELYARKVEGPGCLQQHPITGKPCMRVELSRNSTSEISKEMEFTDEEFSLRDGIHVKIGDKLIGEAITVFVTQRKPIRFNVDEGATHTHGGHFATTQKPTFCKIKYSQEHIRHAYENRQISLKKLIGK